MAFSPDPSVNYNIASSAHHEGTAQWFIESSEFKKWKESESLLWIHGKRMSPVLCLLNPLKQRPFLQQDPGKVFSGPSLSDLFRPRLLIGPQLIHHPGHRKRLQCRIGSRRLLLFRF
jgi:hypothetical protein